MSESTVTLQHRLAPEDQARSEFYALLARLFADAPDAALLAAIAAAPALEAPVHAGAGGAEAAEGGGTLADTWAALRAASAVMHPETVREEYQTLFVGVGRSEVSLYASHYLGPQSGRPLAELRSTLARLGLGRRPGSSEYEDHFAVVLETMRMLVSGDGDRRPAPIAEQQGFFDRHVAPWAFACCAAISSNSVANFYRRVAQFADRFLALERDSFAVEE